MSEKETTVIRSRSATWSMIFGILSLVFLGINPIFPVVSIILAILSKVKYKKMNKKAKSGLIMSIIALVFTILWCIALVFFILYIIPILAA